jgi:hypothetical protein
MLAQGFTMDATVHAECNRPIFDGSAFTVFLVGRPAAVAAVYREWARDYCLLEAGYIGQLLMTVAAADGLGLCPIGGIDFDAIRGGFLLDEGQLLFHSLCGGAMIVDTLTERHPSQSGQRLTAELRDYLKERLSVHSQPSAIVLLEKLPLSANGKIDRGALPLPPEANAVGQTPQNDIERTIAAVWQEVLQVQSVGIRTNYFELGANSLHVIQVHSLLCDRGLRNLSLVDLFRYPTVAELAAHFAASRRLEPDDVQAGRDRAKSRRAAKQRRRQVENHE